MNDRKYISARDFKKRRELLKQRRKSEFWQATWRLLFLFLITGGLCWAIALPNWTILRKSQIEIAGNKYLTTTAIEELLGLSYPESVLEIPSQKLIERLKDNGAIEQVKIDRQLFPPRLIISVRERPPVAIALSPKTKVPESDSYSREVGYLDEKGTWLPKSSYQSERAGFAAPTLRVSGLRSHYLPYWQELYPTIEAAEIEIYELNWYDPANIILRTELGKVHFGAYSSLSHFQQQLLVLSQMQELPQKINSAQIAYIDLKDPESPKVQLDLP